MTAPHIVDPSGPLGEALAEASPDLMRSLLHDVINTLLSADADAVAGAEYGRPSAGRSAQRNGYRHRDLDTRIGTIDVAVPKLRTGTYFPDWLLERRKRAESAPITVVADCYVGGVSTRRMAPRMHASRTSHPGPQLGKTLGINSLSTSQVSRMAESPNEHVEQFRHRPLDEAGPFTFVSAAALTMKVREGGRVINPVMLLATGVNGDGHREVLGMRVATSETGAAWNTLLRRPGRPRPRRGPPGHRRRPRRLGGGDRCAPSRGGLAAVPHPLRREAHGRDAEEHVTSREGQGLPHVQVTD